MTENRFSNRQSPAYFSCTNTKCVHVHKKAETKLAEIRSLKFQEAFRNKNLLNGRRTLLVKRTLTELFKQKSFDSSEELFKAVQSPLPNKLSEAKIQTAARRRSLEKSKQSLKLQVKLWKASSSSPATDVEHQKQKHYFVSHSTEYWFMALQFTPIFTHISSFI